MISEKEMMIVDAVNKLEGDTANFENGYDEKQNIVLSSEKGDIFGAAAFFGAKGWKLVCSVKELEQCIREMSDGAFVPDAKPEFVYGQDVYVEDPIFSNKELKFGCLTLKGDCAILLTGGVHMVYPLAGVSSKPIKTKEEFELEEAKENQVLRVATLMNTSESTICGDFSTTYRSYLSTAKALQDAGLLAEILLPLERK